MNKSVQACGVRYALGEYQMGGCVIFPSPISDVNRVLEHASIVTGHVAGCTNLSSPVLTAVYSYYCTIMALRNDLAPSFERTCRQFSRHTMLVAARWL